MADKPIALSIKGFVHDGEGRYLALQRSADSRHHAGYWDLPGGKVDAGETPDAALRREVAEETGLAVSVGRLITVVEVELPRRRLLYLIFEATVTGGELRLSGEHADSVWVPREALPERRWVPQFARPAKRLAAQAE